VEGPQTQTTTAAPWSLRLNTNGLGDNLSVVKFSTQIRETRTSSCSVTTVQEFEPVAFGLRSGASDPHQIRNIVTALKLARNYHSEAKDTTIIYNKKVTGFVDSASKYNQERII
jgi:hypothetical protein